MAVTQSQSEHQVRNIAVGSYLQDSTAVAFTLTTGFRPRYVRVTNEDGDAMIEWYEGMADAEGMKLIGDTTPMTYAKVTTDGITVSERGFTVGLDTDVNVSAQQLSWMAIG